MAFRSRLVELMGEKQSRDGQRITPTALANATGLARQTIYNWMGGVFDTLDADTADALCRYFKCDLNRLVEIVEKELNRGT